MMEKARAGTRIAALRFREVEVSPRTRWLFVTLEDEDGRRGFGEATLHGREQAVEEAIAVMRDAVVGEDAMRIAGLVAATAPAGEEPDLVPSAAASAIEQALWDLAGRRQGIPTHAALGGAATAGLEAYANINRRTRDRTPEGFVAGIRDAQAAGFTLFKIAPFDHLGEGDAEADRKAFADAITRIEAVREIVGPGKLLVDCHWRLRDPAMASELARRAGELSLYWVECPYPETPDWFEALRRLRRETNERGVLLAGAEKATSLHNILTTLAARIYDVVMPDVKYCGGLRAFQHIAAVAAAQGTRVSPHNPSGPICHAATVHAAATLPGETLIETQFDESPLFTELVEGDLPMPVGGKIALPDGPGLGPTLVETRGAPVR